ncbi:unnamed protein product, partial [Polarella glacialis]
KALLSDLLEPAVRMSDPDQLVTEFGVPMSVTTTLGSPVYSKGGTIIKAQALQFVYSVDNSRDESQILDFEKAFIGICRDMVMDGISVYCMAERSYRDESDRAVADDQSIVMYAMIIMICYCCSVLGRCHPVHSKMLLGFTIVVTVGLALLFAFGVTSFIGLPYTVLSSMCIFILLGVGIDDAFIIADAHQRFSYVADPAERLGRTLAEIGGSITLTSVTDFAAFVIGASVDLPAVRYFCITAGIAVLAVFAIQAIFFCGALILDGRREASGRIELLPCLKYDRFSRPVSPTSSPENPGQKGEQTLQPLRKAPRQCFCDAYVRSLTRRPSQIVILVFFLAVGSYLTYAGQVFLKKGAKWSDYLPLDSYLLPFYEERESHFGDTAFVNLIVTGREASQGLLIGDASVAADLTNLEASIGLYPQLRSPLSSWWQAYSSWKQLHPQDSLSQWLASSAGTRFREDVVLNGEGAILAARFSAQVDWPSDADEAIEKMDALRQITDAFGAVSVSPFSPNFLWLERYRIVDQLTLQVILSALTGVLLISMFFVPPAVALLVTVVVGLINLNILGVMALWDVSLNVSSLIFLVLAIGFSVDYSAHIAEGFVHYPVGTPAERVSHSVRNLGGSVLNGGFSTFLASVVLSASNSAPFIVMFKMFFAMVVLGLSYGLILLPVLLVTSAELGDWLKLSGPRPSEALQKVGGPPIEHVDDVSKCADACPCQVVGHAQDIAIVTIAAKDQDDTKSRVSF